MLTDKEMEQIAERYITKLAEESDIEMVLSNELAGKPYGNVYHFESKEYLLTGDSGKALVGNGLFMVEKKTGRVVIFGTSGSLENHLESYERGLYKPGSRGYWYPHEDRYDNK